MKFVRVQQDVILLFSPQANFVDFLVKEFRNFFGQLIKIHFRLLLRVGNRLQLCNVTITLPSLSMCSVVEYQLINNAMEG